ncbi:MAG: hypothetical protein Q9168_007618 [Polycauliona sp. 1 TL-2023]
MSNLRHVTIFNGGQYGGRSQYFRNVYERMHLAVDAHSHSDHKIPEGIPQLFSVIEALQRPGPAVESLTVSSVSWRALDPPKQEMFQMMKNILGTLKRFEMSFAMLQEYETPFENDDWNEAEDEEKCQTWLDEGNHLELLQTMGSLEHLDLSFGPTSVAQWPMQPVFRDLCWPRLRVLQLKRYKGTDQQLLNLLRRHAATLRSLSLWGHKLTKGFWLYTLREMRSILSLDVCELAKPRGGALYGGTAEYGDKDEWLLYFEVDYRAISSPRSPYPAVKSDRFEQYVLGSNDITLESFIAHEPPVRPSYENMFNNDLASVYLTMLATTTQIVPNIRMHRQGLKDAQ